jgi:biofilm PGA synthesis lipoprotein PgaB
VFSGSGVIHGRVQVELMVRCRGVLFVVFLVLMVTLGQAWPDVTSDTPERVSGPGTPFLEREDPSRPGISGRMVAAQVGLFYAKSLIEVEQRIARLAEAGVNTLIVRVFHNLGDNYYRFATVKNPSGVYFQTRYAPVVDDILRPITDIAHDHGLRVFAWMTTRHANYGFENRVALKGLLFDFEKGTMEPAEGFNLFREEVVTRLEGLYADLARYPVDGILFQDDLILKHNEGFSPEARQSFFQDSGRVTHPSLLYEGISREESGRIVVSRYTDRFWLWTRWKNLKLLGLARKLMDAARSVNPELEFAINLYYESILDPKNAMAWYSQSLETARGQPFDYFSVMAYHRQIQEELKLTRAEALDLLPRLADRAVDMVGDSSRVLMKIQVIDWKDSTLLPREETETVLRAVSRRPGTHLALVPYKPHLPTKTLLRSVLPASVDAGREEESPGQLASTDYSR